MRAHTSMKTYTHTRTRIQRTHAHPRTHSIEQRMARPHRACTHAHAHPRTPTHTHAHPRTHETRGTCCAPGARRRRADDADGGAANVSCGAARARGVPAGQVAEANPAPLANCAWPMRLADAARRRASILERAARDRSHTQPCSRPCLGAPRVASDPTSTDLGTAHSPPVRPADSARALARSLLEQPKRACQQG